MYAAMDTCLPVVKILVKAPEIKIRSVDKAGEDAAAYAGLSFQIVDLLHKKRQLKHPLRHRDAGSTILKSHPNGLRQS